MWPFSNQVEESKGKGAKESSKDKQQQQQTKKQRRSTKSEGDVENTAKEEEEEVTARGHKAKGPIRFYPVTKEPAHYTQVGLFFVCTPCVVHV